MNSSKKLFGIAVLSVLLSVTFANASFFTFFNGNMKSDSTMDTKNLKMTGTGDMHMDSLGNSSNTNMYISVEPGRVEYCFHQDVNVMGHKFSLNSHSIAGINNGFSHDTNLDVDGNGGDLNINDDDSNCNTGNLSGIVYFDSNKNDQYDEGETGAKGIKVEITDEDDNTVTVETDENGEYHITNILEGTVSVMVKTNTLPQDTEPNNSIDNPNIVTVKAHEENDAGKFGYIKPDIFH